MKIPFGSHSYEHRSLPVSSQKLLNLYPETQPKTAKEEFALIRTPGLSLLTTVGTGVLHGAHVMKGILYVVSGTELYSLSSGFIPTLIGTISGDTRASMENNGTQLVITNGFKGYVYSVSGGLAEITDVDFLPSSHVIYVDTYFIFTEDGTGNMFQSQILDGSDYNGLDITPVDAYPDNLVTIEKLSNDILALGENSVEIWYDAANTTGFSFSRQNGGVYNIGCLAEFSVENINDLIFFLGDDKSVYQMQGFNRPQIISDPGVEYSIQKATVLSDAYSWSYSEENHKFYCLTIPELEETWCYDLLTRRWAERGYLNAGDIKRHRANFYVNAYGKHIVGDYQNNNLYEMSLDVHTDNGASIRWIATSPPIHNNRQYMTMDTLIVDIESGTGLTSGQGSDPLMELEVSKNGGKTWYSKGFKSMGKIGEYLRRVKWNNFGTFYDIALRISGSEPIKTTIITSEAQVESE